MGAITLSGSNGPPGCYYTARIPFQNVDPYYFHIFAKAFNFWGSSLAEFHYSFEYFVILNKPVSSKS